VLVDDLEGPATFGGEPHDVDGQPYARLFDGPAERGFNQFGLRVNSMPDAMRSRLQLQRCWFPIPWEQIAD
jgi:hypothetical protein